MNLLSVQGVLRLVLFLVCLGGGVHAWAAATEDPVPDSPAVVLDEATALEISRQLSLHQETLQAIESEFGPFHPSLIEALKDLGRYYMSIGQFQSAAEIYERALGLSRISDGLYSESQLPILQDLINAQKVAGQWAKADDKEHLALHIKTRLNKPGTQAYADAVLAFGDWKIQAVRGNLMQRSSLANLRDIDALPALYRQALGERRGDEAPPLLEISPQTQFDLLYGKAYAQAQLADYTLHNIPLGLGRPVERFVSEYVCRDIVNAAGQVGQSCGMVRRENPQYRDYEMQRQFYRDRIQTSVNDLQRSIEQMQALLVAETALQSTNSGAAAARVAELQAMQANLNRDYRRSVMRW